MNLVNRRITALAIFIGGSLLLILSCRLVEGSLRPGGAGRYGVDPEGSLFLLGGQPRTMDPARTLGGPDSPLGHIFSGLTTLDTNLQVQPDLAAGWTVSDDGLIYTFYLRKNAVFHDGRPLTVEDVVFSWERAADPATGSDTAQTYLGDIVGVNERLSGTADHIGGLRPVDDHTLEVRLTAPVVYFLAKLAYPVAFVVDQHNVGQTDWEREPNGTGPFILQDWRDDEVIMLARFDDYYREPALVNHVVYDLGPGLGLSMYESDEIDLVGVAGATLERVSDPNDPLASDVRTRVSMCTSVIGLNNRMAPFDDVRVRQAFNYALDKELLVNAFAHGSGLLATGVLPPGMPGYTGENPGYSFDPEKARQLLVEAGYPAGEGLPVLTYSTSGYGDVGPYVTAVITMWQEQLNVVIEPIVVDPYTFYDQLYQGEVGHIFSSGWCADYPDPQNFLDILYHSQSRQNIGGFADARVDALLAEARIERDVSTRMARYAEIEHMVVEAAPVVFVSHSVSTLLVKPRVQGYVLTPIGVPQWGYISLAN